MICRLCGEDRTLCDAHIVPKCLLGNIKDKKYVSIEVREIKRPNGEYCIPRKRMPKGPYDKGILCRQCDRKLGVYDQYGCKILKQVLFEYKVNHLPLFSIPVQNFDFYKLRAFFVSMLWRASISQQEMMSKIDLGSRYNNVALDIIRNEGKGYWDNFSIVVFKNAQNSSFNDVISFNKRKIGTIISNCIAIPGYQLHIIPRGVSSSSLESFINLRLEMPFNVIELDVDTTGKQAALQKARDILEGVNRKMSASK